MTATKQRLSAKRALKLALATSVARAMHYRMRRYERWVDRLTGIVHVAPRGWGTMIEVVW